jgi:hypothetical protein
MMMKRHLGRFCGAAAKGGGQQRRRASFYYGNVISSPSSSLLLTTPSAAAASMTMTTTRMMLPYFLALPSCWNNDGRFMSFTSTPSSLPGSTMNSTTTTATTATADNETAGDEQQLKQFQFTATYVHRVSKTVLEHLQDSRSDWVQEQGLHRGLRINSNGTFVLHFPAKRGFDAGRIWYVQYMHYVRTLLWRAFFFWQASYNCHFSHGSML